MKRINVWYFYELSAVIRPLAYLPKQVSRSEMIPKAMFAMAALAKLEMGDSPIPLRSCIPEAKELIHFLEKFTDIGPPIQEGSPPEYIHPASLQTVSHYARQFETTLTAELRDMEIFFVSQVGIYSTTALLTQADKMFGDIAHLLPAETAMEFNEAGKCLALALYTATGFHLLRAVESAVRIYYDALSNNAPRPARGAMGYYLDAILKLPDVDAILESVLRQIKKLHRDPVAHPGEILNQTEATSLIGIAHSAISNLHKMHAPPQFTR